MYILFHVPFSLCPSSNSHTIIVYGHHEKDKPVYIKNTSWYMVSRQTIDAQIPPDNTKLRKRLEHQV